MRRIVFLVVFCLGLTATYLQAQNQILTWRKPDPSVPSFSFIFKSSVVNVEESCKHGDSLISSAGTGFIVGYGDPKLQNGQMFDYLVTNRHVAECWNADHQPQEIQKQQVRVNSVDGTSRWLDLIPAAWFYPNDDSVDLAVTPIVLPNDIRFAAIPVEMFATKEVMHDNVIAEGSPVLLSGYFYQFSGDRKFQPIVRQGILSMVPDEPIMTTTGKPGTVYLCDAHIFGGNSGSPVMVTTDWLGMGGYHLLGVISGYYFEDENFNLEIATTIRGTARANSGIAMVVPADYLKELLDSPSLRRPRDAYLSTLPVPPAQKSTDAEKK